MEMLDTEFKQVLVNYPDDRHGMYWQHRCLVVQGPESRWIGITFL